MIRMLIPSLTSGRSFDITAMPVLNGTMNADREFDLWKEDAVHYGSVI